MYDKSDRLPPVGSLKEALFLTIWSRRQQAEIWALRAQLEASLSQDSGKSFKEFIDSKFPFAAKSRVAADEKMKQMMQKEVAKGVLTFAPTATNFLKQKAKELRVPDDFQKKLYAKRLRGTK